MMKKLNRFDFIIIALSVVCLAVAVVFGIPGILHFADRSLEELLNATVPRIAIGILLVVLIIRSDYAASLKPHLKDWGRSLLWCIPCFGVALANFPYSALIVGQAVIERVDLLWLFILKCLSIALIEELFFRAMLLPYLQNRLKYRKYVTVLSVVLSSSIFALVHLINLFFGAGIGDTLLQIGYTFLIGCMLAVTFIKTNNIWLCVFIHFLFDVGGLIVTDLGSGPFQDITFWILTAVAGTICTIHCVLTLWNLKKQKQEIKIS